ncbi:hypothetical protein [Roseibium sp.]|uniref:hypothetical protein n=1 Tax=Roseibium sp. TaxID=1936156 RepID=UPI003A9697CB
MRISILGARLLLLASALTCSEAMATGLPKPGDFYLIARDKFGDFSGSHKIFRRQSDGLYPVTYCSRNYWVRAHTIAWTQVEVENKRSVRVEFNFGKGWRPICENPAREVTLADIGLTEEARDILRQSEADIGAVNRFSAISNSFQKTNSGNKQNGSFHLQ